MAWRVKFIGPDGDLTDFYGNPGWAVIYRYPATGEAKVQSNHFECNQVEFASAALAQELLDGTGAYSSYDPLPNHSWWITQEV